MMYAPGPYSMAWGLAEVRLPACLPASMPVSAPARLPSCLRACPARRPAACAPRLCGTRHHSASPSPYLAGSIPSCAGAGDGEGRWRPGPGAGRASHGLPCCCRHPFRVALPAMPPGRPCTVCPPPRAAFIASFFLPSALSFLAAGQHHLLAGPIFPHRLEVFLLPPHVPPHHAHLHPVRAVLGLCHPQPAHGPAADRLPQPAVDDRWAGRRGWYLGGCLWLAGWLYAAAVRPWNVCTPSSPHRFAAPLKAGRLWWDLQ